MTFLRLQSATGGYTSIFLEGRDPFCYNQSDKTSRRSQEQKQLDSDNFKQKVSNLVFVLLNSVRKS